MARKSTPKKVQGAIYRARRSLPLVGDLFAEEENELIRRSRQLEVEKGLYKNALTASMRALNETLRQLQQLVQEVESMRADVRALLTKTDAESAQDNAAASAQS